MWNQFIYLNLHFLEAYKSMSFYFAIVPANVDVSLNNHVKEIKNWQLILVMF